MKVSKLCTQIFQVRSSNKVRWSIYWDKVQKFVFTQESLLVIYIFLKQNTVVLNFIPQEGFKIYYVIAPVTLPLLINFVDYFMFVFDINMFLPV